VRTIQDGLGKGRTVVIAAAPECLARPATCRRKTHRHEYHLDLPPNSTRRAGAVSAPKWSREFEGAIGLPGGRKLVMDDTTIVVRSILTAYPQARVSECVSAPWSCCATVHRHKKAVAGLNLRRLSGGLNSGPVVNQFTFSRHSIC
jgi:hypothetical protein